MGSISDLERENRRLTTRLKIIEEERTELERRVAELTAANQNAERRVRNVESSLHAAEDNLEIATKEKLNMAKELKDMALEQSEANEYYRTVKSERDRLLERYHSLEDSAVGTETKIKQLEEKLSLLATSTEFFENAVKREKDRRRQIENDLMEKEDEVVRMRRTRRNLEEEVDDLKAEVTRYRRENESLNRKIAEFRQQNPPRCMSQLGSFSNLSLNGTLASQVGSSSEWSIHGQDDARLVPMAEDVDDGEKQNSIVPTSC
uniref:Myosin_tail_1 domain-containing protein n=1 Tax=Steinernema glaseri TaxID=37863 RepID=A0A1I7ZXC6_9BILA